jgi:putative nucleotidyltransferase with HDIG domain
VIDKKKILSAIDEVPSLPSVVIQLRQYLNDPNVNFDQLSRVLQHDPGLTANILQLANSAYFGWSRSIKSVREAITRLGTDRVFQMVLCMSVAPLVRKPINGYDMDSNGLWEHSIATAICAEQLAEALKMGDLNEAFTSGLLHDLGKIVLGTFVEVDDAPIKDIVRAGTLSFNEAEQQVLGIDHAEAAGVLLRSWNLPDEVVASARWHHEPASAQKEHRRLTDLVHVADSLCIRMGWGMGADGLMYRMDDEAFIRLGVTATLAEEVIMKVTEGMEDLKDLFLAGSTKTPRSGSRTPVKAG